MDEKPKDPKKGFFADGLFTEILLEGLLIGMTAYTAYIYGNAKIGGGEALGRTLAFCTLSISQLIHAFSVRSIGSVFSDKRKNKWLNASFVIGIFLQLLSCSNPLMCRIFKTVSLDFKSVITVFLFALVPFATMEISKLIKQMR